MTAGSAPLGTAPSGGWLGLAEGTAAGGATVQELGPGDPTLLSGATVVVTGAGRGIGLATARALAAAGAMVVAVDRDAEGLERAAGELLAGTGLAVDAVALDITDEQAVRGALESVVTRHGRLDAVVNNAGLVHVDQLLELPVETFRRVLRVNVEGTFVTAQAAARVMAQQEARAGRRGLVVNVSSGAARVGRPLLAAYGASKAAVDHLTWSFHAALADEHQVGTVTVYPGNVREGMWGHLGGDIAAAQGRPRAEVEAEREFQSADEFAGIVADVLGAPGLGLSGHTVDWARRVHTG